jgi:hypothetical protein
MQPNVIARNQGPTLTPLNRWLAETGRSTITGWRWRKKGWLKTVNICGRVYLTAEAIAEFTTRAQAGEFASEHKVPHRFEGAERQEANPKGALMR